MTVTFMHSKPVRLAFPELACALIDVCGIGVAADAQAACEPYLAEAKARLSQGSESEFAEVKAWRQAFARMGLKPTQHRCASEALLRRLRKDGALPRVHPLVDICNAVSVSFAIPVAVFDVTRIEGGLVVRPASGRERYESFTGSIERPDPGEIIFADAGGQAHARRWTNRQSALSAVDASTSSVLVVAEALHADAARDVARLSAALRRTLLSTWPNAVLAERAGS